MVRCKCCLSNVLTWSNDRLGRRCLERKESRASKPISAEYCPVFREAYLLACRCLHGILLESRAVSPCWVSRNCTTTAYTKACRACQQGGGPPRPRLLSSQRHYSLQFAAGWCNAIRPECFSTKTLLGAFFDYDDECCFRM